MKRLLIAVMLLTSSNIAHAEGHWIGPALVGGLIGYVAGVNQPVYTFQPPVVYSPPPIIYYNYAAPQPTPVYGYEWIFDRSCFCTRQILVRIN
jgi:hypothetical protein